MQCVPLSFVSWVTCISDRRGQYFHSTRRGVEYNCATRAWVDTGTEWLRPGVPAEELKNVGQRGGSDAGRAYNDALLAAAAAATARISGQPTAASGSGSGRAVVSSTALSSTDVGTERPLMATMNVPDGGAALGAAQKAQPPPPPPPPLTRRSFAAVVGSATSSASSTAGFATRVASHTPPPTTAPSTSATHNSPAFCASLNPSVLSSGSSPAAASPPPRFRRAPKS